MMAAGLIRWKQISRLSRNVVTMAREHPMENDKMASWQIHSYGNLDELKLSKNTRIPYITQPNQVLVKVEAASVNPIDVFMIGGYGSTTFNLMRNMDNIEFPLILGRDFCGKIVSKGLNASENLSIGSSVWGVVPVHLQGCHAEYVLVDSKMVHEKPSNLTNCEAASILYTGLTAWSGLMYSAGLKLHRMSGLKVLVLGASGGVGTSAVQILRAGGAKITATCASDAVPLIQSLGADNVLDYTSSDYEKNISDFGRFDLVLECAGLGSDYLSKLPVKFRRYVTFTTPLLKNFDDLGLIHGAVTSAKNLICPNIQALKNGSIMSWAYFVPSSDGIKYLYELVQTNQIIPIVENIYGFEEAHEAYQRMKDGHMRGKIVIDVTKK